MAWAKRTERTKVTHGGAFAGLRKFVEGARKLLGNSGNSRNYGDGLGSRVAVGSTLALILARRSSSPGNWRRHGRRRKFEILSCDDRRNFPRSPRVLPPPPVSRAQSPTVPWTTRNDR